jgi:hypothetical protein
MSASSSGFANYLLAELRCAALRARLLTNEIQTMAIALRAGFISPDNAVAHLHEIGVLIEASSS